MTKNVNTDELKDKVEEHISKAAEKVSNDNIKQLIEKKETIEQKIKDNDKLSHFFDDITLFMSLIKDYYQGHYKVVPYKTIGAVVAGLLYVLNPVDFIPDFIPLIGYIDDAIVIAFCLKLIKSDLEKYQQWKQEQTN